MKITIKVIHSYNRFLWGYSKSERKLIDVTNIL